MLEWGNGAGPFLAISVCLATRGDEPGPTPSRYGARSCHRSRNHSASLPQTVCTEAQGLCSTGKERKSLQSGFPGHCVTMQGPDTEPSRFLPDQCPQSIFSITKSLSVLHPLSGLGHTYPSPGSLALNSVAQKGVQPHHFLQSLNAGRTLPPRSVHIGSESSASIIKVPNRLAVG